MCSSVKQSGRWYWLYSNNLAFAKQPCEWVTDVPRVEINVIFLKPLNYKQNAVSLGAIILLIVLWFRLQPELHSANDSIMWTKVCEKRERR